MTSRRDRAVLALVGLWLLLLAVPVRAVDVSGLTHLDGSEVGPAELPENAILIVFATWSPRCRKIMAESDEIQRRWGTTAPVFLVNFQEDAEAVREFFGDASPKATVLLDPRAVFSKAHSITSLPGVLAIKDGTPAFRGKLPSDIDAVLRPIYD